MIRLSADLPDREFVMPGSTLPVRLARLGGPVSLVRFPPGWTRPERGHYLAGEEFVVLEGELRVSGVAYVPGDWAWLPAGTPRFDCATPGGALALAHFDGPPRWVEGEAPTASVVEGGLPTAGPNAGGSPLRVALRTVAIPEGGLTLQGGTALHDGAATLDCPAEVLAVDDWLWGLVAPDERLPAGRLLVRRSGRGEGDQV